jgi:MoxR-like ATPase
VETVRLEGIEVALAHPDELALEWTGRRDLIDQLLAAWLVVEPRDLPLHPRLIGKPGVGKTTLAYAAAKRLGRDVYLFQATLDTRPEDLLITPVVAGEGRIRYVASSVVTAMIKGGVAILDEGNRMSEKSWASLAPLLDARRTIESIVAGVKVKAHPDFRFVTTMNDDASTFELPEYVHSRLTPTILVDFPDEDEELAILANNLPFAPDAVLRWVTGFLTRAHAADEAYTVRDGINVARYALKRLALDERGGGDGTRNLREAVSQETRLAEAVRAVLGDEALRYAAGEETPKGPFRPRAT